MSGGADLAAARELAVDGRGWSLMVDTQLWDVAAGLLLAYEAGAVLDDVPGAGTGVVLATTPDLRTELLRLISS